MATIPYRLQRLLQHKCDIYRRATISAVSGSIEGADVAYSITPVATGVLCYWQATPELDEPATQGITKTVNLVTSDKWHFLSSQELQDGWLIVNRIILPNGQRHSDYGAVSVIQGNPTTNSSMVGRDTQSQWVFAKHSPDILIPGA
jgi:hypothetical protein